MESETIVETQVVSSEPPDMLKVREYFSALQADLTSRVAAIEQFLGFAEGVDALGTRVHKLETFLGIKAG